ncbi:hypothetical protein [Arthrobacter sp. NPDC057009]|uniref:TY-Chap2 family putative peptide chaperone n=1 Tax=Arthrobacter sp. NPDC057009 TaxID=3345996 RepID=UPI0036254782
MIYAEHGTLRYRLINALSWRVASELSRRDAGVYIGLTGDGGSAAQANALMMTSSGGLAEYQARRMGLGFTAGKSGQFKMEWEQAFGMPSARAIAMAMEASLGIHLPEKSPSTTPRALGYRVMASVLEMTVGDRRQWFTYEAEGGPLDQNTASTRERLHQYEDTRWSLYRDGDPLAVLDNFGWLEIGERKIDLHSRYRELNGQLYPLVLEVFGGILP